MSLKNLALYNVMVRIPAPEGGTPFPMVSSPTTIQNGIQFMKSDDPDFATRRVVTYKTRPPIYDARTKSWSKQKRSVSIASPGIDELGNIVYDTIRVELETAASTSIEDCNKLRGLAAYAIVGIDGTADTFWQLGSVD